MPKNEDNGELRYDKELGPGYFTLTPNDFLEHCDELSATAKLLYIVLLMHCGRGESAFPGNDRLCKLCSVKSRTTLRSALRELQDLGLVEVVRRGLTLSNLYIVHKYELRRPLSDGQILTISKTLADGQKMAVKLSKMRSSRRSENDHKLDSVELDSVELDGNKATMDQPEDLPDGTDPSLTADIPSDYYSAWIAGVIADYSTEMGGKANVAANVARAHSLWRLSGLKESAFIALLQQARVATRQAQARGIGNKMEYLLNDVAGHVH